jgi:hypothetical protein
MCDCDCDINVIRASRLVNVNVLEIGSNVQIYGGGESDSELLRS